MPDEKRNFTPQKGDTLGYYRLLNTTVDATTDEITHAWETALIDNHPDLHSDKSILQLEEKLKLINEAKEVLCDPLLRSRYNGREIVTPDMARERADQACREQEQLAQDAAEKKSLADKARERADQACREQKQLAQDAAEKKSLAGAAIYTAWSIMFLVLIPTLSNQVLRIPTTDYIVNPALTSSVVYGLAVALLCLGVNTKIFRLDTKLKKRINYTIIGAQLFSIFVLAI